MAVIAVLAAGLSLPSSAGQASTSFKVSVTLLPANTSCTAGVDAKGTASLACAPTVVAAGSGSSAGRSTETGGSNEPTIGYRSRELGYRIAGVVTEEDDSTVAYGEYSSKVVVAGEIQYVEMTVTW